MCTAPRSTSSHGLFMFFVWQVDVAALPQCEYNPLFDSLSMHLWASQFEL